MKTIWQLTYEVIYEGIPGNGEKTKKYRSFAEAKKDIREIISQIYLSPYIKAIRTEGVHKAYRTAMADFLDNYVSRTDFFRADEALPSDDPDDYENESQSVAVEKNLCSQFTGLVIRAVIIFILFIIQN